MISDFIKEKIPTWTRENVKSDQRWVEAFKTCRDQELSVENLMKLVEFGFCLPGTSAEVERLFSIIFNVWTEEKGQMTLPTLESIINVKFNSDLDCKQFHENNKNDKSILSKVIGGEKY